MKNTLWFKGLRLWVQGLLLLSIRWAQLKSGFDPVTGFSRTSVPGIVLIALILFLAAAEAVICFQLPKGKRTYLNCFEPFGQSHLPFLASGSLLLAAGAVLLPGWSTLTIAAAAAGAASAAGLLLFTKAVRSGAAPKAFPLLPAMIFSILFLLVIYLPEEANPVLARYYLPVLTAALIACSFYQLAGLTLREGKLRWFVFFADLTVPLCLSAMADSAENLGQMLVFFSCALVLTAFLTLRRNEVLPEPEPAENGEEAEAEDGKAARPLD